MEEKLTPDEQTRTANKLAEMLRARPSAPPRPDGIPQVFGLIEVSNHWFHNEVIHIDGFRFTKCRFDNCTLKVYSGNFEMHGCFVSNTGVEYGPWLIRVLKLFFLPYEWVWGRVPGIFLPRRNPDGTVDVRDGIL